MIVIRIRARFGWRPWQAWARTSGVFHVVDQLVIASASTFSLPTADSAERLLDTRVAGSPLGSNARRRVTTVGTSPGDWVVVNATPVLATTPGFGTGHSSDDDAGATSNVNFGPGTIDPNIAIAKVGSDSKVSFTNSDHGSVHLVLDQLVNADAAAFSRATGDGAKRLTDTRIARF